MSEIITDKLIINDSFAPVFDNADQRYPHLTEAELLILIDALHINEPTMALKNMVQNWNQQWSESGLGSPERKCFRSKLLNIAGLCQIFPVEELRRLVSPNIGRIEADRPYELDILDVEISMQQLDKLPKIKHMLEIPYYKSCTYLDMLRDISNFYADFVVFKPTLNDEVKGGIVATSEALSRSVLISTTIEGNCNKLRDPLSVCYDLVMQQAYLRLFWTSTGNLNADQVQANMKLAGINYALSVLENAYEPFEQDEYYYYIASDLILVPLNSLIKLGRKNASIVSAINSLLAKWATQLITINDNLEAFSAEVEAQEENTIM